jgi:UDP-glucose 4-epimerase
VQSDKVLVTGGAGFIGSHVVTKLLEKGYNNIIIIDNLSNGSEDKIAQYRNNGNNERVTFYNIDIKDKDTISHVFDHHTIVSCIHLAAKISVADSITNPEETMNVNVTGTQNILETCSNHNVESFVFASSAAVYGDCKVLPISENNNLEPLSPYGASKAKAERLVSSYNNSKIRNAISLRFFNVYGAGQTLEYAGVITRFAERLHRKLPPIVYGDGTQTRDFIGVDDVVNAILLCIGAGTENRRADSLHEVYNVGTGKPTMIKYLAEIMTRTSGLNLEPEFVESRIGDIKHSYADVTRIKRDFQFVVTNSLESYVNEMIAQA